MKQADVILQMLKAAGSAGVPNYEMSERVLQYNARIFDLRKRGYDIRRQRVNRDGRPSSTYLYFLKGAPAPLVMAETENIIIHQPGELFDLPRPKPKQTMEPLS